VIAGRSWVRDRVVERNAVGGIRVTVVVASRNRRADLLASLPRHEAPVILVDNGSTDGSADRTAATVPSLDPLSTRITGASCRGNDASRSARRLRDATTTVTLVPPTAFRSTTR